MYVIYFSLLSISLDKILLWCSEDKWNLLSCSFFNCANENMNLHNLIIIIFVPTVQIYNENLLLILID